MASEVIIKRIIRASRNDVFSAWIDPEMMSRWMVGGPGYAVVTNDVRVGGSYTNDMFISAGEGSRQSDPQLYRHTGQYIEIAPPERLVFSWNSPSVSNTEVSVVFREVPDGTEVTICHRLLEKADVSSHQEGWSHALGQLASVLDK